MKNANEHHVGILQAQNVAHQDEITKKDTLLIQREVSGIEEKYTDQTMNHTLKTRNLDFLRQIDEVSDKMKAQRDAILSGNFSPVSEPVVSQISQRRIPENDASPIASRHQQRDQTEQSFRDDLKEFLGTNNTTTKQKFWDQENDFNQDKEKSPLPFPTVASKVGKGRNQPSHASNDSIRGLLQPAESIEEYSNQVNRLPLSSKKGGDPYHTIKEELHGENDSQYFGSAKKDLVKRYDDVGPAGVFRGQTGSKSSSDKKKRESSGKKKGEIDDGAGIDDPFESLEENIQDWNYAPPKKPDSGQKRPSVSGLPSVGKNSGGGSGRGPVEKQPSGGMTKGSSKGGNRGSKLDSEIIDDDFEELSDYWN
jgi:hypothetical protein